MKYYVNSTHYRVRRKIERVRKYLCVLKKELNASKIINWKRRQNADVNVKFIIEYRHKTSNVVPMEITMGTDSTKTTPEEKRLSESQSEDG